MNKNFSVRYQSNRIQHVAPTSLRGKLKCQFLHALYANGTLFHVVDDWGGIISTNHTAVRPLKITWCQPRFKDVFCGKVSYFWDVFPELQGKYLGFSNWLTLNLNNFVVPFTEQKCQLIPSKRGFTFSLSGQRKMHAQCAHRLHVFCCDWSFDSLFDADWLV